MNTIAISGIILIIFFVFILVSYFFSFRFFSKDLIVLLLSILFVIAISLSFIQNYSESFYFEVSPQRKKCLEEQVSLIPREKRSCACCQKGTVGGYPPHYRDWFQPTIKGDLWHRADNWTLDADEQTLIPPTEFVEDGRRKLKRSTK